MSATPGHAYVVEAVWRLGPTEVAGVVSPWQSGDVTPRGCRAVVLSLDFLKTISIMVGADVRQFS